ncbi:MAG: HAD family phosphatase [Bacteroidales bacterium]|nr:HAD family phosphatase [Bacteroidota bacterium]MBL6949310.1 HAD family phosphatase [Bacteroidales bacterium]
MAIKNIIFDFGGVICNIDISLTEKAFYDMGLKKFDKSYSVTDRDNFFGAFETGRITPQQFRDTLKEYVDEGVTDDDIDTVWNALLLDIPKQRIDLLKQLRSTYRLFLLSNTNEIHYKYYLSDLQRIYGFRDFNDLFDNAYFSHRISLRKPFPEIFEFVIKDAGIKASDTMFIDDSTEHVEGARKAGLHAYYLKPEEDITELFNAEMQFLRPF